MKKPLFLLSITPLVLLTACNANKASMDHPRRLFDYVVDIGTITEFDEQTTLDMLKERFLHTKTGCSSIVTQVDGHNLVGRNMDMTVSEAPIIKFTLDINEYKAIGLTYPVYEEDNEYNYILNNGLSDYLRNVSPYVAPDYLNEEGLYIETNMRSYEVGLDVTSTNPTSNIDIFLMSFPAYASTRCKNVNEVVELANKVNLYTSGLEDEIPPWNYAFLLADAEGNYGLMEVANNKVIYLPNQNGQANYYVADEFKQNAKFQCGEPRYNALNKDLDKVKTQDDMLKHMENSYYSYVQGTSNLINAPYDIRSEWAECLPINEQGEIDLDNGSLENCTTEWVMDPSRKEELLSIIEESNQECYGEFLNEDGTWNIQILREAYGEIDDFWISMYSVAVDCNNKSMKIRFFEDSRKELIFRVN